MGAPLAAPGWASNDCFLWGGERRGVSARSGGAKRRDCAAAAQARTKKQTRPATHLDVVAVLVHLSHGPARREGARFLHDDGDAHCTRTRAGAHPRATASAGSLLGAPREGGGGRHGVLRRARVLSALCSTPTAVLVGALLATNGWESLSPNGVDDFLLA